MYFLSFHYAFIFWWDNLNINNQFCLSPKEGEIIEKNYVYMKIMFTFYYVKLFSLSVVYVAKHKGDQRLMRYFLNYEMYKLVIIK